MDGPEAFGGWPRDVDWWLAFLPGPDQEDEAPSAYGKFVDAFIELVRERGPRVAQELLNEFVRMYGGKEPRPKSPGRPRRTTPEQAMSYSRAKKRTKKQYLTADLTDPDDERNERKALRLEKSGTTKSAAGSPKRKLLLMTNYVRSVSQKTK